MTDYDLLHNEDEIEYFGFLPVSFTLELTNELEKTLLESIENSKEYSYLKQSLTKSFEKNMFLLSNFLLKNVFKFPKEFKWERMASDKIIEVDLESTVNEYKKLSEKLQQKEEQLNDAKLDPIEAMNKYEGYKATFENREYWDNATALLEETEKEMALLQEEYKNYSGNQNKEKIRRLLEHKNMKAEFYKNEKKRLYKIAKTDVLEEIVRQMKE